MQNHYNFSKSEVDYQYFFETINNVSYAISFLKDETFNSLSGKTIFNQIFQIVIEKKSGFIEPFDAKVSKTIQQIVIHFLSDNDNTAIYFCSFQDKKELKRYNAFNRWYDTSVAKQFIEKEDNIISIGDSIVYTSLVLHQKNSLKKEILEVYFQLEDLLNTDK